MGISSPSDIADRHLGQLPPISCDINLQPQSIEEKRGFKKTVKE
jgi:hypothetical protein